jgi:hypothetical protein
MDNIDAKKSIYIALQDSITEQITHVAFPENVQVGLPGYPGELSLTGRLALTSKIIKFKTPDFPSNVVLLTNDDIVMGITTLGDAAS